MKKLSDEMIKKITSAIAEALNDDDVNVVVKQFDAPIDTSMFGDAPYERHHEALGFLLTEMHERGSAVVTINFDNGKCKVRLADVAEFGFVSNHTSAEDAMIGYLDIIDQFADLYDEKVSHCYIENGPAKAMVSISPNEQTISVQM